jgi:hypothetical protein
MNKKSLIYIVGGLAVLGIGYYIYKKRSKAIETPNQDGSGDNRGGDVSSSGGGATTPPRPSIPLFPATTPVTPPVTPPVVPPVVPPATSPTPTPIKLSNDEVDKRVRQNCGFKPASFLTEQRRNWNNCKDNFKASLRAQGLISFDGGFMDDFADDNYGL